MPIDKAKIEEHLRDSNIDTGLLGAQATMCDLAGDVRALLSEREEMLSLLREVEWQGRALIPQRNGPPLSVVGCPCCHGEAKPDEILPRHIAGHAPDCRLAALLK